MAAEVLAPNRINQKRISVLCDETGDGCRLSYRAGANTPKRVSFYFEKGATWAGTFKVFVAPIGDTTYASANTVELYTVTNADGHFVYEPGGDAEFYAIASTVTTNNGTASITLG